MLAVYMNQCHINTSLGVFIEHSTHRYGVVVAAGRVVSVGWHCIDSRGGW